MDQPTGIRGERDEPAKWDLWQVDGLAVHATYDAETWTPRLLTMSPQ